MRTSRSLSYRIKTATHSLKAQPISSVPNSDIIRVITAPEARSGVIVGKVQLTSPSMAVKSTKFLPNTGIQYPDCIIT